MKKINLFVVIMVFSFSSSAYGNSPGWRRGVKTFVVGAIASGISIILQSKKALEAWDDAWLSRSIEAFFENERANGFCVESLGAGIAHFEEMDPADRRAAMQQAMLAKDPAIFERMNAFLEKDLAAQLPLLVAKEDIRKLLLQRKSLERRRKSGWALLISAGVATAYLAFTP